MAYFFVKILGQKYRGWNYLSSVLSVSNTGPFLNKHPGEFAEFLKNPRET